MVMAQRKQRLFSPLNVLFQNVHYLIDFPGFIRGGFFCFASPVFFFLYFFPVLFSLFTFFFLQVSSQTSHLSFPWLFPSSAFHLVFHHSSTSALLLSSVYKITHTSHSSFSSFFSRSTTSCSRLSTYFCSHLLQSYLLHRPSVHWFRSFSRNSISYQSLFLVVPFTSFNAFRKRDGGNRRVNNKLYLCYTNYRTLKFKTLEPQCLQEQQ